MSDKIDQQILDTLKLLEKSIKSIGSVPQQRQSSSSQQKQYQSPEKVRKNKKNFKGEDAYESELINAAKSFKELTARQKKFSELRAKLAEYTKDELKNSEEGRALQQAYNKALAEQEADLRQSSKLNLQTQEYQKLLNKQLHEQEAAINHYVKGTDTLSTTLGKSQRKASLLTAALVEQTENFREGSSEYSAWIAEFGESTKGLNVLGQSFLKSAGIVDNITGEMRDNISARDFAGLRLRLGEAQETISESFSGLEQIGVTGLQSAIDKIASISSMSTVAGDNARTPEDIKQLEVLKENLRDTAEKIAKANISMGEFSHMFDANGKMTEAAFLDLEHSAVGLGKHIQTVADTAEKVAKKQDALAKSAHTASGKVEGFVRALNADPVGFSLEKLKGKIGTTSAIMGGLAKTADGLKRTWDDAVSFNIAQVPASFLDVQAASIKMGMSFDETTKFLQENKRMLAIYGSDGFGKLMGEQKDIFAKFGYNMKQAGEIVGPAIEAGISSGINVKSGEALNKFIDQSMDSFKNISAITNVTAKEYMALNAELLNSQDIAGTMIGMDQERAQAHAKEIISLRDEYTQRGLSVQQANELLKIQQQQQREKVSSRVVGAAKGAALAASLGLSADESNRYQQLSLKGNKTADEMAELQNISNKMGKAMEEQRNQAYDSSLGAGFSKDIMFENLDPGGAAGQMISKGVDFAKAERADVVVTKDEARAKADEAQGSKSVAELSNATNSLSSIFNNTLTVAALGAATALAGVALQGKGGAISAVGDLIGRGAKGLGGKIASSGGVAGKAIVGTVGTLASGVGGAGKILSSGAGAVASGVGGAGKILSSGAGAVASTAGTLGKGLLSGAGSLVKGLFTGPGAITSLLGMAGEYAGDKIKESGHEKTGSAVSALSTTAKYAGTGAAIGSLIPVIGTGIGAGIGGLYGAYKGISENSEGLGKIFTSDKKDEVIATPPTTVASSVDMPQTSATKTVSVPSALGVPPTTTSVSGSQTKLSDINTGTDSNEKDKSIEVSDIQSHLKLAAIAESLVNAVNLLQQMVDNSDPNNKPSDRRPLITQPVPTSFSYVTGRV